MPTVIHATFRRSYGLCLGVLLFVSTSAFAQPAPKIHDALAEMTVDPAREVKAWVFFTDKGYASPQAKAEAVAAVARSYNPRAVQRRAQRGLKDLRGGRLFDETDLPVSDAYVAAVKATGARVHVVSSWVNAASVYADQAQLEAIAALPFVQKLQPVARAARRLPTPDPEPAVAPAEGAPGRSIDYGNAQSQLAQMNVIALHDAGYTGQGVVIGVLDSGFKLTHEAFNHPGHELNVVAAWDFINNDGNVGIEAGDPPSQHDHGTKTLSCIGAYKPGSLVGGAYNASFILCKTEDTAGEYQGEEDNYVAGLQFIEANGGDMATASLGYIDWYTQADLDGVTAVTTIAVNIATANGLHCCNAAGNEYHDSNPATSSIIAPADAFQVITCGAVNSTGGIASFSSDGPTADGRVKPELLARGVSAAVVSSSSDTSYTSADGTSFATPLIASAVGCVIGARPNWSVDRLRERLFETADYFVANGTYDPLYVRGYGIIDAYAAYDSCSDAGEVSLDRSEYACSDTVEVLLNDCHLNTNDNVAETVTLSIDSTSETGVEQIILQETDPSSAEFVGTIAVDTLDASGVLLVSPGDAITVTYVDADDGAGGVNVVVTATATVDCTPPAISNVRAEDVDARNATIRFDADEPVRATVHYGLSCGALNQTASSGAASMQPAVALTGLLDAVTYAYAVEATDEAGNATLDDAGGACYVFTTPDVPNYFTELFDSGNDLDNLSITFVPDASPDGYTVCAEPITELPTDPAGGTMLSLSVDDNEAVTLSGGATVVLYGVPYATFYPASNGYVTFGSGDTDYTESLTDHFDLPRISALFDDLNPSSTGGGTVSYRQLADRVAVTWDSVPEYTNTGANTFQVVMYFDGTIELNYLTCSADDGLVGLSEGDGLPAVFYETDLSAAGACGPKPPVAQGGSVTTPANTARDIVLAATDDGLPEIPGALDYEVLTLPSIGTLSDPGAGAITAVPYTLVNGGNVVHYAPDFNAYGADSFTFLANDGGTAPDGGDSNVATVSVTVVADPPVAQNANVNLARDDEATISLSAIDPNSDVLTYTVQSLPAHGVLRDVAADVEIASAPYSLAPGERQVRYTPDAGYAGSDGFTFRVTDGIFDSNIAVVSLLVIAPPPTIETDVLPDGGMGAPYGPVQLSAADGQPPLAWSLVEDLEYLEIDLGTSGFVAGGAAQNFHVDDAAMTYYLPFVFPFYGEDQTNVQIWSNGFLNFGVHTGSSFQNSTQGLMDNVRIAPLWDDLQTTGAGEDVFIDESTPSEVTIRWAASTRPAGAPVNVAVTLRATGQMVFHYGPGNASVTPTVGVSGGPGQGHTLSAYDGATSLTSANSMMLRLPQSLPDGLTLSAAGEISGTPQAAGAFEPTIRVTDALGRSDTRLYALAIAEDVPGDADGDGDVDLVDYAVMQRCFTGAGGAAVGGCGALDVDGDGDVDLVDFGNMHASME